MHALFNMFPADDFSLVAVILLLPLVGAFVNGVFGKRLGKEAVRLMGLSAIGGSFLASLLTFFMLLSAGGHGAEGAASFHFTAWHWLDLSYENGFRSSALDVAFLIDHLSVVMMLVITG